MRARLLGIYFSVFVAAMNILDPVRVEEALGRGQGSNVEMEDKIRESRRALDPSRRRRSGPDFSLRLPSCVLFCVGGDCS